MAQTASYYCFVFLQAGLLNSKDEPEPEVPVVSPLPRGRSRKISSRAQSVAGVQGSPTRIRSGSKAEKKKRRRTVAKMN